MIRTRFALGLLALCVITFSVLGQNSLTTNFVPVTDEMLKNPSPNDWLMFSRTYDAQRFSPLNQINKQNVGQLRLAWQKEMGDSGSQESIPLVYQLAVEMKKPWVILRKDYKPYMGETFSAPHQFTWATAGYGVHAASARAWS